MTGPLTLKAWDNRGQTIREDDIDVSNIFYLFSYLVEAFGVIKGTIHAGYFSSGPFRDILFQFQEKFNKNGKSISNIVLHAMYVLLFSILLTELKAPARLNMLRMVITFSVFQAEMSELKPDW